VSLAADHKALVFLGAVALLGAGVRIVRSSSRAEAVAQPALERQLQAVDSATRATSRGAKGKGSGKAGRGRGRETKERPGGTQPRPAIPAAGSFFGKLDLDAATSAQIESLPGIGPALARRIVAVRALHGPFVDMAGLQRVRGLSASLIRALDTLVTFSGTLRPVSAAPESISARPSRRRRPQK